MGGAADTMRYRHSVVDAPCDDDVEPALRATRRALYKRVLRERWMSGPSVRAWPTALPCSREIADLFDGRRRRSFGEAWETICDLSPALQRGVPLRPSDLPRQIAIARMIVQQLRLPVSRQKTAPDDRLHRGGSIEPAVPS